MLFNCPHCKGKCQFNQIQNDQLCQIGGSYQAPWVCQNCNGFIITKKPYKNSWSDVQIFPLHEYASLSDRHTIAKKSNINEFHDYLFSTS